jgi:hypothetical protein
LSRNLRSVELALRMLRHEARTHTISAWTLLSPRRVRSLSRRARRSDAPHEMSRHRGPSPTRLSYLLTSAQLNQEFSAIAGVCQWVGVLPEEAVANAGKRLPGIERGEKLCYSLELFQAIVPYARITLEQLVLLVTSLAERTEWQLGYCRQCSGVFLIDLLKCRSTLCAHCEREHRKSGTPLDAKTDSETAELPEPEWGSAEGIQQSLF